jgi:hypothetical protein
MRISASLGSALDRAGRGSDPAITPDETARVSLPVLVPESARAELAATRNIRPAATLLAQLVAGAENLPTSRARRRADPQSSAGAYRTIADLGPSPRWPASRVF